MSSRVEVSAVMLLSMLLLFGAVALSAQSAVGPPEAGVYAAVIGASDGTASGVAPVIPVTVAVPFAAAVARNVGSAA